MAPKFITVFLFASLTAWGQAKYAVTNFTATTTDVTTMTASVNAWKTLNGVCLAGSLAVGSRDHSLWCRQSNHYWYKFNRKTRAWDQQTAMGTSVIALTVEDAGNIFGLESTPGVDGCGTVGGFYFSSLYHWTGSAWTGVHGCFYSAPSIGWDGFMSGIGWDSSTGVRASYTSTNGGSSWTLWSDNIYYVNMNYANDGCAISNTGALYRMNFGNPDDPLPPLPSGTPATCIVADMPTAVVAMNTAGKVYVMPLENYGSWQSVTGLTASQITGPQRFLVFATDAGGNVYHWNVNAPTVSATWGGTWGGGCPTSAQPCSTGINQPTHTLSHQIKFKVGGLYGSQYKATQTWNTNFAVTAQDIGLGCDPFFGNPNDPACTADESNSALCNASGSELQTATINYVVDDSTDVMNYQFNTGENYGPTRVVTGTGTGYWLGEVINNVSDACPVSDPVPVCPAISPADIYIKAYWFGGLAQQGQAYKEWFYFYDRSIAGLNSPYVYDSFYLAQELPDGTLVNTICFGDPHYPTDFLNGSLDIPHCK